jgi:hypothetical protein
MFGLRSVDTLAKSSGGKPVTKQTTTLFETAGAVECETRPSTLPDGEIVPLLAGKRKWWERLAMVSCYETCNG